MMKAKLWNAGIALAMLAACSSQPSYAPKAQDQSNIEKRASLHTQLAASYYSIGNNAVALQEIDTALQVKPDYAPAYSVQGLVYMALNDDNSAEKSFKKSLSLDGDDPDSNNNYGWFLCQRHKEKDGIKYFMKALKNPLYQTPEKAWDNAGICARQINDTMDAQAYFNNALSSQPNDVNALYHLADMSHARGDDASAQAYLARIPDGVQPSAALLWLQVRVSLKMGDRDDAASYGFKLRQNFPDARETQLLKAGQYD